MTATAAETHELVDIIDLQPMPGEYVGCQETSSFAVFGVEVERAFHRCHAARMAVQRRWDGRCECCHARLRYAHVTQDGAGEYHCYGHTCLSLESFGEEATRKLEYSQRIDQKERGFVATFSVPAKLWDLPREQRPAFARLWKGQAFGRRSRGPQWKLSVWGDNFEGCLANCVALAELLGVKLA